LNRSWWRESQCATPSNSQRGSARLVPSPPIQPEMSEWPIMWRIAKCSPSSGRYLRAAAQKPLPHMPPTKFEPSVTP
jgi:hypothetical protein